jgi:hypothetical protein
LFSQSGDHRALTSKEIVMPKLKHLNGDSPQAGQPRPTHATNAANVREAKESQDARNAEASSRDRMVEIGRGNQQAGRQGQ